MIGGKYYIFRGSHLSLALVTLVFTTVLLWTWEKNPFRATLLSVQHQFSMPFSDSSVGASNDSLASMSPKGPILEINSNSRTTEEIKDAVEKIGPSPMNFTAPSPLEKKNSGEGNTSSSKREVCNYAKGGWVADSRRPLYSGSGCKQWLSGMWACRLMERTEFSYEGYRWQPKNCKMPEFERSTFLRRMQDKTIAIIGDSLGRQQFQSLMCMATGGEESPKIENVGWAYGLVKPRGAIRPDGWAYRFPSTNTTILYYWSASLCDLQPINITDSVSKIAMHLDRPPAFMRRFLHRFDVLVLNTGHHWNRGKLDANRWVMHVNGNPNEDRKLVDIGSAKNFTVYSVVRWVDSQLPSHPHLKAFFRTISPRHFRNGDWNTGGSCNSTTPLTRGSKVTQDGSNDKTVEGAVKGTRVKILDVTALSELRDEGHISGSKPKPRKPAKASKVTKATDGVNDCLHWCLPGIPDTWNELLVAQI